MLRACGYCGKIHGLNFICPSKPLRKSEISPKKGVKRDSDADRFRGCFDWKTKRELIKRRDKYLCVACLNGLRGTKKGSAQRACRFTTSSR